MGILLVLTIVCLLSISGLAEAKETQLVSSHPETRVLNDSKALIVRDRLIQSKAIGASLC
jgi:hypothetical protein